MSMRTNGTAQSWVTAVSGCVPGATGRLPSSEWLEAELRMRQRETRPGRVAGPARVLAG